MKKLLVLLLVLVPALLLIFVNAVYSAPPGPELKAFPSIIGPVKSFNLDIIVNIPDPVLHTKLHDKTGVPLVEAIHASDLKTLTGDLDLHGLGIANAEGLQYCANVKYINLEDNELTDMPGFSHMDKLFKLNLAYNKFTAVPNGLFSAPALQFLFMNHCPVTSVDPGIAELTKLIELDLSNTSLDSFPTALLSMNKLEHLLLNYTPLKAIPDNIDHMTKLENLDLCSTGLESLPSSISGLTNLHFLNVSDNKLGSLPNSICSLHLSSLNIAANNLYSLPAHIGDNVAQLKASCNHLTAIPQSVIDAPDYNTLSLLGNRLTSVPPGFADRIFEGVNLDFNFIDVSPGSPAREILDASESTDKYYMRQLTPVKDLTADPSSDSVTLSWSPCPNGSDSDATWVVESYVVYQYTGEMVKIADVDKSQTSYTHTGLTPETAYSYRVGVNYHIVDTYLLLDFVNRGYTSVDTTTLGGAAEAASSASPAVSAEASPVISPDSLPAAEETGLATPEENAFPVWAIIIAAVGALGIIGTGVAMVILKAKKTKV